MYFLEEYADGLLLLYTAASNERYQRDLGERIRRRRGVARMWMRPDLFRSFYGGILQEGEGYVYLFSGRRESPSDSPCEIRPNYRRRIEYRGNDATMTIAEVEQLYGITPDRVYLRVASDLKLHITNDGLYGAQQSNERALELFYSHLDSILLQALELKNRASMLGYKVSRTRTGRPCPSVCAGEIVFRNVEFDDAAIKSLQRASEEFRFIDHYSERESSSISGTAIDGLKGTVFNFVASPSRMVITPKYGSAFESFISFYRNVVEAVDEHAELNVLAH